MNSISILYCISIVSLCAFLFFYFFHRNLVYTPSTLDHRSYLVRNLPDKTEAANLLAKIRAKMIELIHFLKDKYPLKKSIALLEHRFQPDQIRESEEYSQYTSYSINKGEQIIFCLRSKDGNNTLISENTLFFVALHELGHIMTVSVGHTKEFWDNFRFLLAHAIHLTLYIPENFKDHPVPYCGTHITDSPLALSDIPRYLEFDKVPSKASYGEEISETKIVPIEKDGKE